MRKDEAGVGGTIINISSTAALVKFPFLPIYSGSKMAVLHFSQSLAVNDNQYSSSRYQKTETISTQGKYCKFQQYWCKSSSGLAIAIAAAERDILGSLSWSGKVLMGLSNFQ